MNHKTNYDSRWLPQPRDQQIYKNDNSTNDRCKIFVLSQLFLFAKYLMNYHVDFNDTPRT